MELLLQDLNFEIIFSEKDDFSIEFLESPIELVFEEPIEVERSLDRFLSKNIEKFITPYIPAPKKGKDWKDGTDWTDWKTPEKWKDYFTKKELTTIKKDIKDIILAELPKYATEDDIIVKINDLIRRLPEWRIEKGATFLRQLLDVKMWTLDNYDYALNYNKSTNEFTLNQMNNVYTKKCEAIAYSIALG